MTNTAPTGPSLRPTPRFAGQAKATPSGRGRLLISRLAPLFRYIMPKLASKLPPHAFLWLSHEYAPAFDPQRVLTLSNCSGFRAAASNGSSLPRIQTGGNRFDTPDEPIAGKKCEWQNSIPGRRAGLVNTAVTDRSFQHFNPFGSMGKSSPVVVP